LNCCFACDKLIERLTYAGGNRSISCLGQKILDFGCGPGRDLKTFAELGHIAIGLEGAERLAVMARAHSGDGPGWRASGAGWHPEKSMGLDLSSGVGRLPLSNGLSKHREDRLLILEASMNVLGDNHVVDGLLALP
jgi:hypothetical protein